MIVKEKTMALVSVNRNVIIVPKVGERLKETVVRRNMSPILHRLIGPLTLAVFASNEVLLDGKNVGQYDATTYFELTKEWEEFTEEEKINMLYVAYHTPVALLLQAAHDERVQMPATGMPPRGYLLSILEQVKHLPVPPTV